MQPTKSAENEAAFNAWAKSPPIHFDMNKAKLMLWANGEDAMAVEQAHTELLDKGYIAPCPDDKHEDNCMVILR